MTLKLFPAIAAFLLFTSSALAGQFEEGVAARNRGDFTNSLRIFAELASKGDVSPSLSLSRHFPTVPPWEPAWILGVV